MSQDKTRYLVKWRDFDESEQTWELEDRFMWVVYFNCPKNHLSHSIYSGSRDVLEAYWEKFGGKPDQRKKIHASKSVKKVVTFKSAVDESGEWLPPVPSSGNWDALVQDVETLDKDEKGAVCANLLWNEKKKDGGPIHSRAPITTCYMACPQKVRDRSICHRFLKVDNVADVGFLREADVSCMPIHFFLSLTISSFPVSGAKGKPHNRRVPMLPSVHELVMKIRKMVLQRIWTIWSSRARASGEGEYGVSHGRSSMSISPGGGFLYQAQKGHMLFLWRILILAM